MSFRVRLQGGPFDGERLEAQGFESPPAALWVERCASCGVHALESPTPKGEKYRNDDQAVDGYHLYVYTDDTLGSRGPALREREKLTA